MKLASPSPRVTQVLQYLLDGSPPPRGNINTQNNKGQSYEGVRSSSVMCYRVKSNYSTMKMHQSVINKVKGEACYSAKETSEGEIKVS